MKPLIVILFCAATALAQLPTDKTFEIPDFKVTEQSLRRARKSLPMTFLYPPELRNGPTVYEFHPRESVCLKLRSYRFDASAAPKLVSQTDCTMSSRNTLLRVQR